MIHVLLHTLFLKTFFFHHRQEDTNVHQALYVIIHVPRGTLHNNPPRMESTTFFLKYVTCNFFD